MNTNIQDGVTIHVDAEFPVSVGAGVSVNGARIGKGSLIAAGALVPQGIVVPPRSLVTGVPGSVRRELSDAEIANNQHNAQVYQRLIELHRDAVN